MAERQMLVVEDEILIAESLRRKLMALGYGVAAIVASGEAAVRRAEEIQPDLVLMDIGLSGEMDGVDAAEQIRARFNIPVVYVTSYTDEATLDRTKVTDPWGYIVKPVETKELRSVIELALHKHEMARKVKESEERYHSLFEDSPVSLWEEDFSAVKAYIDDLRASGVEDFRTYFEDHPQSVVECASLVKVVEVNQATLDLYQAGSEEEFRGGLNELFGGGARDVFIEEVVALCEGKRVFESEAINRTLTGDDIYISLRWRMVPGWEDTWGKVLLSIVDLTEHKRMEAQMVQAQRMEMVGRLAGGVAHNFNNLLTGVIGFAELARESLPEGDPARADIDVVLRSSQKMADLTRYLLAFGRRQVLSRRDLCLNDLILRMEETLASLLGESVDQSLLLAPELGTVKADPHQIEQVLLNLVLNAQEAMPDGGRLTLETSNVTLGEADVLPHDDMTSGDYVMLSVSDTGVGMDEETMSHLFEPFYSTRGLANATGLGSAVAYGIIKQHGGDIWVHSEKGEGSRLQIYLPRVF